MIPVRQVAMVLLVSPEVPDSQVYKVHRVAPDPKVPPEILDQVVRQVPEVTMELTVTTVHQEDKVQEEKKDRRENLVLVDRQAHR